MIKLLIPLSLLITLSTPVFATPNVCQEIKAELILAREVIEIPDDEIDRIMESCRRHYGIDE